MVRKIEIISLSLTLEVEYTECNGGFQFLCFKPETPFLGKFGPTIPNCLFKVKFGT